MWLNHSPFAKLRIAFVALGGALLIAIGVLSQSALSQLAEQRRLRHRMVSERVFDEMEREISAVLLHEAKRRAAAYDATAADTHPNRWGPFIIGYYRRDPAVHIVAEDAIDAARRGRIRRAVMHAASRFDQESSGVARRSRPQQPSPGSDMRRSSPDILRQLNRGIKVREHRQRGLTQALRVAGADLDTVVIERESPNGTRREGFVVDMPSMISTIQTWVLGAQGLDAVASLSSERVSIARDRSARGPGTSVRNPLVRNPLARNTSGKADRAQSAHVSWWRQPDAYHFSHRLAPPLDSHRVALRLSRLDDRDASSALFILTLVLIAAMLAGLFALYRMVLVRLRFAERQDNFVSAVTHELKTPLTAIRMYGEMLRDGLVDGPATRQRYYAMITAEGERLTRLIHNVMEHARLRRGQRQKHIVRADVGPMLHEVIGFMTPHLNQEGFEVTLDIEDDLPAVSLDIDALKQVLYNVIENAIKYGSDGEQRALHVACRVRGDELHITVRDFGPGVPEAQLPSIFEPFFRGQHELTRTQKGTGIGLSLVRDLVVLMQGSVRGSNRNPGFEVCISFKHNADAESPNSKLSGPG